MILFELYRQLDVRMYQTIASLDATFGACAKYIMQDDSLVILGSDHSVRLNMANKEATIDNPIKNWDLETEPVLWFSEGSAESAVVRAINNAFRQWLDIDPFKSNEDYFLALEEINSNISKYNLRILVDSNGMCIYCDEKIISFEQAIEIISETDLSIEQNANLENVLAYAQQEKGMGQLANAIPYYEQILRATSRPDLLFTIAAFELAECYYFIGNYDRAVSLYYRCNLEFIVSEDDFYIHLGHALLDVKMKKYEREIKIYYRSKLDPDYVLTHGDAVAGAAREVAGVFAEYEETCLEMGKKKYAEHRNHLPIGADDIDELLVHDEEEEKEEVRPIKIYEGIKLTTPLVTKNVKKKSDNELFAEALDLYIAGDYQKAFDIYYLISKEVPEDSDYFTWAQFQMGKLYCIFDDYENAREALLKCDPNRFGMVYRQDDFLVLYKHVVTVCDDFESDINYRKLIRGRFDFYFAQYDSEYNQMLRDHRLVKKFVQYEKDCIADAKEEFRDILIEYNLYDDKPKKRRLFGKKKG
ncbi:MAG: tetratricopeptide repeat protein [Lachnospiraceae bacterium]|nr:tetratricopeptide repeat protein [Lachnospiraceae bacterium]